MRLGIQQLDIWIKFKPRDFISKCHYCTLGVMGAFGNAARMGVFSLMGVVMCAVVAYAVAQADNDVRCDPSIIAIPLRY